MTKRLPARPNPEFLRKQAKELRRDCRAGLAEAVERLEAHHPRYDEIDVAGLGLQDAQLAVAREYGYASWPRLIEVVAQVQDAPPIKQALDSGDLTVLRRTLDAEPNAMQRSFGVVDRRGRVQSVEPVAYAERREWAEAMALLLERGAAVEPLQTALFGTCENHNLASMRRLLAVGVDPNSARNSGWDCDVLYGLLQTYHRSAPAHLRACINTLIGAGAVCEDAPDMDMHRGDLPKLEARLNAEPQLAHARFDRDYGDHLTLRGATLLHIAVEYHYIDCIDLLLKRGADLDARAAVGANGVGGQTPFFHAIGSNQGTGFHVFEYLLEKGPDLTVKACIQGKGPDDGKVMDCVHKGRDHGFDKVLDLTPLGYAELYVESPEWRSARREAEALHRAKASR